MGRSSGAALAGLKANFHELHEQVEVSQHLPVQIRQTELGTVLKERVVLPFEGSDTRRTQMVSVVVENPEERGQSPTGHGVLFDLATRVFKPVFEKGSGLLGELRMGRVFLRTQREQPPSQFVAVYCK